MFRYLDAQMLKCLDTWLHGCSDAQLHMLTVLSTVHCPIISCFLTVVRCITILGEFDIFQKMTDIQRCASAMSYFPLHKSSFALAWLCVFPFTYMTVVYSQRIKVYLQCTPPLALSTGAGADNGIRRYCAFRTQPSSSSSTHCRGIWQCKESSSHSAAALLQCRETRHAQSVPPFSHSGGGGRPLLPVTFLNHRIFSILDIRFTHGRFYRLICPLCVFCNQLLSVSQFFSPEREIHSLLPEAKCGRNGNADLVFFGRFVQILNLI